MTNVTGLVLVCFVMIDLHLTFKSSGLYENICFKESEVWQKVISNKIIVSLSHKVCCPLSSPVLLHKLTNDY